jgi:hypothetical protein
MGPSLEGRVTLRKRALADREGQYFKLEKKERDEARWRQEGGREEGAFP